MTNSYLIPNNSSDERIEEDGVVISCGVDGLRGLQLVVNAQGQMRRVHSNVHLLPLRVVQVLADDDALVLGDEVGVKVQLAVLQLQAEVGVALTDGHQPVTDCGPEFHVQFVAFGSGNER